VRGSECSAVERSELVSNSHDLPVIVLEDGRVHDVNDAARRLLGDLPIGANAEDLFAMNCRERAHDFLSSEPPTTAELMVNQRDAPTTVRFVLVASGVQRLLIASAIGESYPRSIEARLMTTNSDLANMTRELSQRIHELDTTRQTLLRTNEAHERLRTELETMERLRGEWAALVAHDLRQPVATITLAAGILLGTRADTLSSNELQCIERIRSASKRLHRMITDLTEVSQVESKRLSVEARWLDVGELTRSFAECVEDAHALRVKVHGDTFAWVDPDRIHQILGNLTSNAIKYGRPRTDIAIDVVERDDAFVEVVVTNQGDGIAPDEMPQLFSRFTRLREARESRKAGLGVGLYITKGLVEAHGGQLWAESIPKATTSFHFTVPRSFSP
jgi:signal transduction histidine kinase